MGINIMHLKYAVEVADAGSINKASEILFVGQPNLSRAIKDLETSLGITIFDRSAKGMVPTAEGEEFLDRAKALLQQMDELETIYGGGSRVRQRFSISVPRVSYISEAFAQFSRRLTDEPAEIYYKETNALKAIDNILHADYKLGIIRYARDYEKHFESLLAARELGYELITEFQYVLIMHKDNPLARKETIFQADLKDLIEIAHSDPYVPSLTFSEVRKTELTQDVDRHIFVFERAGQFDLLTANHDTFMWVSPVPDKLLKRYDLVQRTCADNDRVYRDVLIYRNNYRMTELDRYFIAELNRAKQLYL